MRSVFWFADGAGHGNDVAAAMLRWIRTQSPELIIYGGDVYNHGTEAEYRLFREQAGDVSRMCAVGGNHDWDSHSGQPFPERTPVNYERFWSQFPPPLSAQPIDASRHGGARYDHFKDVEGWRLVFVDTGPCNRHDWPMEDPSRTAWLRQTLTETPGRAKILFAHHSRLSRGKHGNNETVDRLWQALFDEHGSPLAALTVGGHDHNVTWYEPRPARPEDDAVPFDRGIFVHVNGAGGHGHDEVNGLFTAPFLLIRGTRPEFFDDDNWCVTRIDLIDARSADVSILSFGSDDPPSVSEPTLLRTFQVRL